MCQYIVLDQNSNARLCKRKSVRNDFCEAHAKKIDAVNVVYAKLSDMFKDKPGVLKFFPGTID